MIDLSYLLIVPMTLIGFFAGYLSKNVLSPSVKEIVKTDRAILALKDDEIAELKHAINVYRGRLNAAELPPSNLGELDIEGIASAVGIKVPRFARPLVQAGLSGLIERYKSDPAVKEKIDGIIKGMLEKASGEAKNDGNRLNMVA